MSKRPAVSLVELLVVLSFSTVILTTSAGLIHKAMRAETDREADEKSASRAIPRGDRPP